MKAFIVCLASALLLPSCVHRESVDFERLYGDALREHSRQVNPVIVIPGILGSRLKDRITGEMVWGEGKTSRANLALPLNTGFSVSEMTPRAVPDGALDTLKFRVLGLPVQQKAYAGILRTLGTAGYIDEDYGPASVNWGKDHFTCFQFSYDWRLSNVQNAQRLHEFIEEKKAYIQKRSREIFGAERKNLKFDIVAHSMGGLLARYYLRYGTQPLPRDGSQPRLTWAGAQNVDQLIMVGTSNSGSISAFQDLQKGQSFVPDWQRALLAVDLPNFDREVIGTYPSIYELLPRPRHEALIDDADDQPVDLYDAALWENQKWGMFATARAASDPAQVRMHMQRNLKHARQFHRAIDRTVKTPAGLSIRAIVGDSIKTRRQIKVNLKTGELIENDYAPGDGIVLRSSVLADERIGGTWRPKLKSPIDFTSQLFLPEEHLKLTTSATFTDNVLHYLLEN